MRESARHPGTAPATVNGASRIKQVSTCSHCRSLRWEGDAAGPDGPPAVSPETGLSFGASRGGRPGVRADGPPPNPPRPVTVKRPSLAREEHRSRLTAACAAVAALLPALSTAAEPPVPVVVTATRTAQPIREVLASVEVLDAAELDRLPAGDLSDALRFFAGVEVARSGGPGQQTSLFLRGTESNHVLVLVDGVRINPGTSAAPRSRTSRRNSSSGSRSSRARARRCTAPMRSAA